eukprot:325692_1
MALIASLEPTVNITQLKRINIVKNKFVFGRLPTSDHVFTNLRASGTHAIIQYNPSNKAFILLDKSSNGTHLNAKLIGKGNKVKLNHNDTISFVPTHVEYKFMIPSKTKPKPKPIPVTNLTMMSLDPFAENNDDSLPKPTRKRKQKWIDEDDGNHNQTKNNSRANIMVKAEHNSPVHTPAKKKR